MSQRLTWVVRDHDAPFSSWVLNNYTYAEVTDWIKSKCIPGKKVMLFKVQDTYKLGIRQTVQLDEEQVNWEEESRPDVGF